MFARLAAQTTQGQISGRVFDLESSLPLASSQIKITRTSTKNEWALLTDTSGFFNAGALTPGFYQISAELAGYQKRLVYYLELPVGGYLNINFGLRSLRTFWEREVKTSLVMRNHSVLSYLGPDLDPAYSASFDAEPYRAQQLEPSLSGVIDPVLIAELPFTGRDIYSALALMPGVSTDTATGRSLGLSSNGQRPTASNFLLDGVEHNNHLTGGPALILPPESIQEFRVSTNNFSAEYGRTSGQIANAVTRLGGERWKTEALFGIRNEALNANSFADNTASIARGRARLVEPGLTAGGPLKAHSLFAFFSLDDFRNDSVANPEEFRLPTAAFLHSLPPSSLASGLLASHPLMVNVPPSEEAIVTVNLRPTVTYHRWASAERLDAELSSRQRVAFSANGNVVRSPDFIWTPYGNSGLSSSSLLAAISLTSLWTSHFTTEARSGFSQDSLGWRNPFVQLPNLSITGTGVLLPGQSSAGREAGIAFHDHSKTFELAVDSSYASARNTVKLGGGALPEHVAMSLDRKPTFSFLSLNDFVRDSPFVLLTTTSRIAAGQGRNEIPAGSGNFRYGAYSGYVQDDFRVNSRLTVYGGIRLESFTPPRRTSREPEYVIRLGDGGSVPAQVAGAIARVAAGGTVFNPQPVSWNARGGFAVALGKRASVLRGGFGTFADRAADNIWLDAAFNDFLRSSHSFPLSSSLQPGPFNYLQPVQQIYTSLQPFEPATFYNLTAFAIHMYVPTVNSGFVSLQSSLTRNWMAEVSGTGSRSERLFSNDIVNRKPLGHPRSNTLIDNEDLNYRANQAYSDYSALIVRSSFRTKSATLEASYTWSHAIDNQSDPLLGNFFDLGFSNQTDRVSAAHYFAGFTRQYDPNSDRGNSDFDQRHTAVGYGTWTLPGVHRSSRGAAVLNGWLLSGVSAVRSGLPYTVFIGGDCKPVCNTRADLIGSPLLDPQPRATGGKIVLDRNAFAEPAGEQIGNVGRNSFRGAWFYNFDLSVARTWHPRWLGDVGQVRARADLFNVLNHSNFNNPQAYRNAPDFGLATKGRIEVPGFASLTPLNETARQIEIRLRIDF